MDLATPISNMSAVGRKTAPTLKKLGLETARDLIFYWPFRYEDWSQTKTIAQAIAGDTTTIKGHVELIQNKRSQWKKRLVTEAIISDTTGKIRAVWFHQPYLTKNLKPGDEIYLSGNVESGPGGLQFVHPTHERVPKKGNKTTHTARLIPVYSLTGRITQKQLRYLISCALPLTSKIPEWLPLATRKHYALPTIQNAINNIHFPTTKAALNQAEHRLKFDELLLITLRAQRSKYHLHKSQAHVIKFNEEATKVYVKKLPFTLTTAQRKTAWEILTDLQRKQPMNRLLEGDVGSGKTVVASIGILNVLLSDLQAAYMAPTEILAQQQYESMCSLFKKFNFTIALLTGSMRKIYRGSSQDTTKKTITQSLATGKINLIIGTHALIYDTATFARLGLAIIDEQHRFGVNQRAALAKKYSHTSSNNSQTHPCLMPHFLSMTATPVPRSLALTLYGDLDLSIIGELPKGRLPIETKLVAQEKRGEYYAFVKKEVNKGRQVYVICPLIDPSDKLGKKAVTEEHYKIQNKVFPELRVGLLHGKMKSKEKDRIMQHFARHELDILVATPVIEVGIDVPNATIILIESAERFGLAQLHQLRGRVGRGTHQSYCLLLAQAQSRQTRERLQALADSTDGFKLAEKDLEFRGPGEVYGFKQHGFDDILKVAKLTDYAIIKEAQETTKQILNTSPDLKKFPHLKTRLEKFEESIHLE